jgi:glycosyltransferase involved in cell wall biosynthesis
MAHDTNGRMDERDLPFALLIAYHFPPQKGSSGIQRTLRFCRYLPEFGWRPVVITANPMAYASASADLLGEIPAGTIVKRAFALDAARHLSMYGRYPVWFSVPDRWSSWLLGGVAKGLAAIWRYRPKVIWSTYPIATAHVIAYVLHRLTGIPWVADFRDPMAQEGYPEDPRIWRSYKWIERKALQYSSRCTFTSPGAIRDYHETYPDIDMARYLLVENGYDEEAFSSLGNEQPRRSDTRDTKILILHSGIVYTSERDPSQFLHALGELKRKGILSSEMVEVRFRASSNHDLLHRLARENDVEDLIAVVPPIGYTEALAEMKSADALLVMQAASCNSQIPAKVYEYLRVGRPILALADPNSDTAGVLVQAGLTDIASLESTVQMQRAIPAFLDSIRSSTAPLPDPNYVAKCTRKDRTRQLAEMFDQARRERA